VLRLLTLLLLSLPVAAQERDTGIDVVVNCVVDTVEVPEYRGLTFSVVFNELLQRARVNGIPAYMVWISPQVIYLEERQFWYRIDRVQARFTSGPRGDEALTRGACKVVTSTPLR